MGLAGPLLFLQFTGRAGAGPGPISVTKALTVPFSIFFPVKKKMAALTSRAGKDGSFGFFRWSLNIFRALSTSPASSSTSAAATGADVADPKKAKRRKKKKNLFEVAQFLPHWGIGYKMAKSHWRDVSYEITKINLYKDGRHGKAWGIRHKAGLAVADSPVKISGVHKRGWKYFPSTKVVTNASKAEEIQA